MGLRSKVARTLSGSVSATYMLLTVGFVTSIVVANLIEIKTVDVGWFTTTAGVLVFPFSYIINDCVVEVYGLGKARLMIWIGLVMSMLVTLFLQVAIWLPGSSEWGYQQSMVDVYGTVPRVMGASFLAFLAGSLINAVVMNRMKQNRGGRSGGFRLRAIVSTIWGEGADSLIFFPVAFAGILPVSTIVSLIATQTLIKTLYEVAILPVTVRVVRFIQRIDHTVEETES